MEYHLNEEEMDNENSQSRLRGRLRGAFQEEERQGLLLSLKVRSVSLIVIIIWQIFDNSDTGAVYFFDLGEIVLLLLLGLIQLVLIRSGRHSSWMPYFFVAADCLMLSILLVMPNPFEVENGWPMAIELRGSSFVWYFIFLMQASFSLQPLLVLWCGLSIIIARLASVFWIISTPGAFYKIDPGATTSESVLKIFLDKNFVFLGFHIEEILAAALVSVGLAIVALRMRRFVESRAFAERSRSHLARYFSPNMLDEISDAGGIDNTPHDQNVAVLFVDIIGFTTFCETEPAANVVSLLREYHSLLAEAVFRHDGTLDKYMGDGLMATFGTPRTGPHDATDALRCALYMVDSLRKWSDHRVADGLSEITVGVGIHYGIAVVGDIGDERHVEFAVIGDTVNVASRIEHLTRELKTPLTVSDDLVSAVRHEEGDGVELLGKLTNAGNQVLVGRKQKMSIWTLSHE